VKRAKGEDTQKAILGRWFTDWGIPTAISTFEAARAVKIPIISSGGIRTGIECAKAIALGATLVGVALPVLAPAATSSEEVSEQLKTLLFGLKATMFLVGASNLRELGQVPVVIGGNTRNWLELRGRGQDLHWLANRTPS
jgi:isopentenyl-diphosphate delta-isomerase